VGKRDDRDSVIKRWSVFKRRKKERIYDLDMGIYHLSTQTLMHGALCRWFIGLACCREGMFSRGGLLLPLEKEFCGVP